MSADALFEWPQGPIASTSAVDLFAASSNDETAEFGSHLSACGCASCAEYAAHVHAYGPASPNGAGTVSDFTALLADSGTNYSRWNANGDDPAVGVTFITYSFRTADNLPGVNELYYEAESAFAFTADQQTAARDALAQFAAASGIVMVEVAEGGMIDLVGITGSTVGGYSSYANTDRSTGGLTTVDATESTDFSAGTWAYFVLLHEVGHRVGLKHSFADDVVLEASLDNHENTVMSYDGGIVDTLGPLDIDALHYLYGENIDLAAAGITYSWDEANGTFTVNGAGNDDIISAVAAKNVIDGGDGNDSILGAYYDDSLYGASGDDTLVGGDGQNLLDGGDGNDSLAGYYRNDTLYGGDGNDTLDGSYGSRNELSGGEGNDLLISLGSRDTVTGGLGDDTLSVTHLQSNATYDGGDGHDVLSAEQAAYGIYFYLGASNLISFEEFRGSVYDDYIYGDTAAEHILGGSGNDTLRSGGGADTLEGGDGDDQFLAAITDIFIDGGAGQDTLTLQDASDGVVIDLTTQLITGTNGLTISFQNIELVETTSYADVVIGNEADNIFVYVGGADAIDGGAGIDVLSFDQYSEDLFISLEAQQFQWYDGGSNAYLSFGDVSVTAVENLLGNIGDDHLEGNEVANEITGASGDDSLYGHDGADSLFGGNGNDVIEGGDGNDLLVGDMSAEEVQALLNDDFI